MFSITVIIILMNVVISLVAFQDMETFNKLCFWPVKIWHEKEWLRLLSGSFLHANMPHLFFNMLSLYFFGPVVENNFSYIFGGTANTMFIVFYMLAAVGANIPDLYQHRYNESYRAVGASGAVSAVIFSSILFDPLSRIGIFPIPVGIPAFLFGGIYLLYSAYMAKRGGDNIGHLAHFSGAVFGLIFPLLFHPNLFSECLHKIIAP